MSASFNLQAVGTKVSSSSGAALSVPIPAPAPDVDLIVIIGANRTLSSTFVTTPASQGFTQLKVGTSTQTQVAAWGKIADGTETAVNFQGAGVSEAQAFLIRVSGATWASIGSAVVDSPASTGANLGATGTTIRFQAITPTADHLCVVRISARITGTSSTIVAVAASTNFANVDGSSNPLFAFINNAGAGLLLAAEISSQSTATAVPIDNDAVSGLSDLVTSACSMISFTLQATGVLASPSAASDPPLDGGFSDMNGGMS